MSEFVIAALIYHRHKPIDLKDSLISISYKKEILLDNNTTDQN
jgi:hypothetical protein